MRGYLSLLAGACAAAAWFGLISVAEAGGLGIREQSATSMGAAYAGNAAGGDLSSSFWNSGALGTVHGLQSQSTYTGIFPHVDITTAAGSTLGGVGDTTSLDRPVLLGSSAYGYELSPNWVLGLGINAPFGLSDESNDRNWAAQYSTRSARMSTININPMLAYRLPGVSFGVGAQIERMDVTLKSNAGFAVPGSRNQVLTGDDFGFGFTAGLLLTPMPGTSVGLGFRSSVKHELEGRVTIADDNVVIAGPFGALPVTFSGFDILAELETPETVTLSLRQEISPALRVMGTLEWMNWSRFGDVPITARSGGSVTLDATGQTIPFVKDGARLAPLHFGWEDSWFVSAGGEFDVTPALTLRGGAAYERSPIRDVTERPVAIPDADRIWASAGLSYKVTTTATLDLAYSHLFFGDAPLDVTERNGVRFVGDADVSSDILAVGLRMQLGGN